MAETGSGDPLRTPVWHEPPLNVQIICHKWIMDYIIPNTYAFTVNTYNWIKNFIVSLMSRVKYILPFVIVYGLHILATHFYANICVSITLAGFINSLFLIGSPICSMILQIINNTNTAFIAIISSLCLLVVAQLPRN
jgi:hypothetical protein